MPRHTNPTIQFLLIASVLVAASCAGRGIGPRTAPFRERPDSVEAGQLACPFSGRVIDESSGDPIAGALVYATWTFASGYGVSSPGGSAEVVSSTDAAGYYKIPRVESGRMTGSRRLTDFHLVVYKRGYVAYRSDRRFDDLGLRQDFAQLQNSVSLERWRSGYSHVRHLRYVGGGPAIVALTTWETTEAAAELAGGRSDTPKISADLAPLGRAGVGIVAAQLLNDKEIKQVTSFDGAFETGPLRDEPDTVEYSSQHFKALGRPETFDLAIRLWKLGEEGSSERYQKLTELLPNLERRDEIADESSRATESGIYSVIYVDKQRGAVVMLTCGQSQCDSIDDVVTLARSSYTALSALLPIQGGI